MRISSTYIPASLALFALTACSDGSGNVGTGGTSSGGAIATGGGNTGGGTGGTVTGGTNTGGQGAAGATGGTGGTGGSTGGLGNTGGQGTGGTATGGSGGSSSGGSSSGGTGVGGSGATGGGTSTCSDPDENSALEPTFTTFKLMMEASPNGPCSASDCHGVNDLHPEKLVLEDDAGLLDRMKTHVAHRCNDLLVVVPGEPENSALVRALRGECTDSEGDPLFRMPGNCNTTVDCNCFYPSWMEAIEAWILAGAEDN